MTDTSTRPRSRRSPQVPRVIESTVEPKLVERRRQVRAEARRTRVRRWIALGVVSAVIAAAVGATLSPLLDVDSISVKGNSVLTDDEIAVLSGVAHGDHMVSVDLADVRTRLMSDPRIASARVALALPGTVEVRIVEERPLIEFAASDGALVLSETGRVIATAPQGAAPAVSGDGAYPRVDYAGTLAELPRPDRTGRVQGNLSGPTEDLLGERLEGVPAEAALLVKRLPADLLAQVSSVRIAADRNVILGLTDGAEVKLGQPTEIEAKVVATKAVLSQVVLDCLKSIDVREPTRAAVSRGPGCPGISPEVTEDAESGEDQKP